MKLVPTLDHVLVAIVPSESKYAGTSIIRPETVQDKYAIVEVIDAGPGRRAETGVFMETHVKAGARGLVHAYVADTTFPYDNKNCAFINEASIIALVE